MLLVRTTFLLFTTHLRRIFTTRRALVCIVLALLPALVAFLIAHFSRRIDETEIVVHIGGIMLLQIVVPLLALIAGSAVVAEEVEDRTITYLFSRPIPRASLLFGRWLATFVFLAAVLALATWLFLHAASTSHAVRSLSFRSLGLRGLGEEQPVPQLAAGFGWTLYQAVLLGATVYSALFAVAGIVFKSPILVGLGYTFAVEGFLANLPGGNQALTIQFYLRSWMLERGGAAWKVEGVELDHPDKAATVLTTLACVLAVTLAFGAWRIVRREFVLTS
ncbi:MAG TPA: ABC transporter permease [Planctomycetota bacterium]|nr:ABC transporter permease [Planctomycetota bacterium]